MKKIKITEIIEKESQSEVPPYEQIGSLGSFDLPVQKHDYTFSSFESGYIYIRYDRCQSPCLNMSDYKQHRTAYLNFLKAIKKGNLDKVKKRYNPLFLPYSMSPDDESGTSNDSMHIPLYYAIKHQHKDVVEFLLEKIKESKQEYILFFSEQKVDESFKNTTKSLRLFKPKVKEKGLTLDVSCRSQKKYKKQTFEDVAKQFGLNSIAEQIAGLKKISCYSDVQYHVKSDQMNNEGWKFHISFLDDIDKDSKNFTLGYEISCKIIMKHLINRAKIIEHKHRKKYKESHKQRGKIMTIYACKETRPPHIWKKFAQELTEALAKAGVKPGYLPLGNEPVQGSNYLSYRNDDPMYQLQKETDPYQEVVVVKGVKQPERPKASNDKEEKLPFFSFGIF